MIRYRTKLWQHIRTDQHGTDAKRVKHLREIARPRQIAFQKLMGQFDGNPVGIECKSSSGENWAFVLPEASSDSPWRIQRFDQDGFYGHSCFNSLSDAVEALIMEGFVLPTPGALDRCSTTLRWAIGIKREELRQLFNQGKLGWAEMIAQMQSVASSPQAGLA